MIDEYTGSESGIVINDTGRTAGRDTELSADQLCADNPYKPLSSSGILAELAESRACYLAGEGEDLDKVLDEIGDKYGL